MLLMSIRDELTLRVLISHRSLTNSSASKFLVTGRKRNVNGTCGTMFGATKRTFNVSLENTNDYA